MRKFQTMRAAGSKIKTQEPEDPNTSVILVFQLTIALFLFRVHSFTSYNSRNRQGLTNITGCSSYHRHGVFTVR